jgi:acetaldehyde dehydrogenase (acetylating)
MDTGQSKISLALVAAVATFSFIAGAATTWTLFGASWSYKLNFGFTISAEWVAAVSAAVAAGATGWIGFGANKLAGNSYHLKLHERREVRLKSVDAALVAIKGRASKLSSWISMTQMMRGYIAEFPYAAASRDQIESNVQDFLHSLKAPPWGVEDLASLSHEEVSALTAAERKVNEAQAWVQAVVLGFSRPLPVSASSVSSVSDAMKAIAQVLAEAIQEASKFAAHIDRDIAELTERRSRISARLARDAEGLLER